MATGHGPTLKIAFRDASASWRDMDDGRALARWDQSFKRPANKTYALGGFIVGKNLHRASCRFEIAIRATSKAEENDCVKSLQKTMRRID
jgi:hypothetical protein